MGGGFPRGTGIVLRGSSGNEMDLFAVQFLAEGLRAGEAAVIIVPSTATRRYLTALAKSGIDVKGAIKGNRLKIIDWLAVQEEVIVDVEKRGQLFRCSADLTQVSVALDTALASLAPAVPCRAVVAILSPALRKFRLRPVYAFAQGISAKLVRYDVTALVLLNKEMHDSAEISSLSQPFDGVIEIDRQREGDAIVRKIGVVFMRDTVPDLTFRPLELLSGGKLRVRPLAPMASAPPSRPAGIRPPPVPGGRARTAGTRPQTLEPSVRRGMTNGLGGRAIGRTNGLGGPATGRTNGLGGRTNGLTNGLAGRGTGKTNGLVNGLASMKRGMTNGLTNGTGFTNGLGSARSRSEAAMHRWKLYVIPIVCLALLTLPFLGPLGKQREGPTIDGVFDDWSGVAGLTLTPDVGNPNAALTRVAVANNTEALSLLVEVQGSVLAGAPGPQDLMDAVYVLIDTDRDAGTGYAVQGVGADRLLEVQGRGGIVYRALAHRASDSIADRRDWRIWVDPVTIAASASGNKLELAVDWWALGTPAGPAVFVVAVRSWDGATDFADLHLGLQPGHLIVAQRHVQPTVMAGPGVTLLAVDLTAVDTDVAVSGLNIEILGTSPVFSIGTVNLLDGTGATLARRTPLTRHLAFSFPPVTISRGTTVTWTVSTEVMGTTGDTLGVRIPAPDDVEAGGSAVTLRTDPDQELLGYVGRIPAAPSVDGAFAEWTNEAADASGEPETLGNPSVDIDRFGAVFSPSNLTFHLRLLGPAFAGTVLTTRPQPAPSQPSGAPDADRDSVPDSVEAVLGPVLPYDFNNDNVSDADSQHDADGDGALDYSYGPDVWLNTTVPGWFPAPHGGRSVSVYIGPTTASPAIGEDRARVFIDADNVSATGFYLNGIGADYMVEMRGREGIVVESTLFAHAGSAPSNWTWTEAVVADVDFAVGLTQFEARAYVPALVPSPAVYVEVSDWSGGEDSVGIGTRGGTRSGFPFTGIPADFRPMGGGDFAYASTGAGLDVYARGLRGSDEEILIRCGSLFLGWRTTGLGGTDAAEAPAISPVRAAGRTLVFGGFPQAMEEYEVGENRIKHNVWLLEPPALAGDSVSLEGQLRIPRGSRVLVDGQPWQGPFSTASAIEILYDGYGIRLDPVFAYESRRPDVRVPGRYVGEVRDSTVHISMAVPAGWLVDAARQFPVVLDPSATGIADTATSTATGAPSQRKVFYDGTNFWAFYSDGTTIQYEPSSDGLSWVNTKNAAFTSGTMARVSTWFHDTGSSKIVYIAGDVSGGSTKDIKVRRGTISGTTITWGTEGAVTMSSQNIGKRPFITRDSSGYVWIAANVKEGAGAYDFAAARSTAVDDVSNWNARTLLLSSSIANDFVQGVILPLGSGDVYALWYADGAIGGKKYSGSWGSLESIDTTTAGSLTKAPSAVVDASLNVDLVYVDSAGGVKYRQRTSSWGSATTLDSGSGNAYPTISRDTGTGDLYAFWISSTNQIKAQKYSGSWNPVTLETNTRTKVALTSVYNASSSSKIAWTWSQGSASPYDVKFSVLDTSVRSRTIDTSTDSTPVSYNHQRKLFFDGSYLWAFYFDGSNTVYTYSADPLTWENPVSQAFTTSGVDCPAVWYHDTGSTKIVYAVGDDASNDGSVVVRRGTISGTTITWGTEAIATVSASNLASKVAFITRDTNGNLWIASNDRPTAGTYNVGVIKSTVVDDVSTWGSVTDLMSPSISVNRIFPTILPLSGGNLYAVWYAEGAIDGKRYTGTWGSLENIATTTSGVTTKIPSAVVDASDYVDLVYSNVTGAIQFKQRTSSWGSATTLDSGSGSTSPTITLETGTGNLYVFYLSSTSQVKGKRYSGSWTDVTDIDTSTIVKSYITSPYSAPSVSTAAWMWDQGGSSPYEVKIQNIPEFEDIAVPIALTLLCVLRCQRRRRRTRGACPVSGIGA